jgi:hypothetical protein
VDASAKERFVGVDVPDPGDRSLVEECRLAPSAGPRRKAFDDPARADLERLRSGLGKRVAPVAVAPAVCTPVDEAEAAEHPRVAPAEGAVPSSPVGEVEAEVVVSLDCGTDARDPWCPAHPGGKEERPVAELDDEAIRPAMHPGDPPAGNPREEADVRGQLRLREVRVADRAPDELGGKVASHRLDFG